MSQQFRTCSDDHTRCLGFTLIELVMVIGIIAIITTIATPRYMNSLQNYRVKSAAQRVVVDLEYARNKAKSSSASLIVEFLEDQNRYRIQGELALNDPAAAYKVQLDESPYHSYIQSLDLGGDGQVVFDGYGNPEEDGVIILRSGTTQLAVMIDATTGTITIEQVTADLLLFLSGKGLVVAIE